MSVMPRTQRDFIAADLAAVESLISELTPSDFLSRASLEGRRDALNASLEAAEAPSNASASATLLFGGSPVMGSKGIDADFGATVIAGFQDLVSKVAANRAGANLRQRGPVSHKDQSRLNITGIAHGSFGFLFEEIDDPLTLFESPLKAAVDEAVKLITCFDVQDRDSFDDVTEDINDRILETVRKFLGFIHERDATFRILSGEVDRQYDRQALARAVERVSMTHIDEHDEAFAGQLIGLVPGHRWFEYRVIGESTPVFGRVDRSISASDASDMLRRWLEADSVATVRTKRLMRNDSARGVARILLGISARTD